MAPIHLDTVRYPESGPKRDEWIAAVRPARNKIDPGRPYAFLIEQERTHAGRIATVAAIFLTNRECPWKCVMCDLWRNTLEHGVPPGAIPSQIDYALSRLPRAQQVKLYNSGSFFDRAAVPREDFPDIAQRLGGFERVIVECHPALITPGVLGFKELLPGQLEIAMGLETVHPAALEKLNKRMTLEQFARAAEFLRDNGVALRVFVLVQPPFVPPDEAAFWMERSIDFAFDCGATVCSLIPTRSGNGALDVLAEQGQFSEPRISDLEEAAAWGVNLKRGRVFADLWDLERFSRCAACFPERARRLREMNDNQIVAPHVRCRVCAASTG